MPGSDAEARWLTPDWPAPPSVRAVCSTRIGGVSSGPYAGCNLGDHVGDEPALVAANRAHFVQSLAGARGGVVANLGDPLDLAGVGEVGRIGQGTFSVRTSAGNSTAAIIGLLVVLQLWLLTATMNAWMGGDHGVVWPAAVASLACFAFNLALVRRLNILAEDPD
mgnify:CR=1 FL=1